ncbi:MAG: SDR family oxidoreductase [Lentisphaerae bacterium]|nr:SDR family oxidoreductase [Lentisphaerota bacterium]
MDLKGRTVLVTGGAIRIGRAICIALMKAGSNVVVHFNSSEKAALELVEIASAHGVKCTLVRGDLSLDGGPEKIVKEAWDKTGGLHALVNNAAVFHKDTLTTATEKKLEAELKVNFTAPVVLTREIAALWRGLQLNEGSQRIRGKIVNLLDRRILGHDPECLLYALSKKMLAEFTESAALELAPIATVNGVAPGAILPPPKTGTSVRDMAGSIPMGRKCTPEEVADAVIFLLRTDAITGQILFVDGGQHLH